jgi:APA family basic amino acid/polyamine antiporter
MARDGVFFKAVAAVHPRFGTPARAIALQAALASLLVASGTFNQIVSYFIQIVSYFIFVTVLFVGLTVAGLFVLRRREMADAAYRTPGYPVTPAIFLVLVAVLLILLAGHNPLQAALGAGIVGLGAPVYLVVVRRRLISEGDETS